MNRRNRVKLNALDLKTIRPHCVLWGIAFLLLAGLAPETAAEGDWGYETRLMFVGEDLEVLSIASKHPERAQEAPAVAQVLNRDQIDDQGILTMAEALSLLPGFYMVPREWGSQPYLRGLADSILFLYDGVPLTTDSTKNIFPLDRELSLDLVDRIEVVRGPGSVLWGPDAFAGVVNVVPLNGRDSPGLSLKSTLSHRGDAGATLKYGKDGGNWDWLAGANFYQSEYWDPHYDVVGLVGDDNLVLPFEERFGSDTLDRDHYVELTSNLRYGDWLRLSGRFSDYVRHYTLFDPDGDLKWSGERSTPFSLLKLEIDRRFESSSLRLNSYYSHFELDNQEIDLDRSHRNEVGNVELLYDRELWDRRGLLTLGTSYRYNWAGNVAIDEGYIPDFVSEENQFFVPRQEIVDYTTSLYSVFGQFRAHTPWFDAWVGARYDDHNQYKSTLSLSGAITRKWGESSTFKLLYGSAFRTPFASQFFDEEQPDPEQIRSLNLQWLWEPSKKLKFSTTGFVNWLEDHISEDPFGSLSTPTSQSIYGVEVEGRWSPSRSLSLWANASFFDHEGDDQLFRVLQFTFIAPDGTIIREFEDFAKPFEVGPDLLNNVGITWKPTDKWTLSGRLSYFAGQDFVILPDPEVLHSDSVWLVNLAGVWHPAERLDFGVSIKNALDQDAKVPGTYGLEDYPPLQAFFWMELEF